MNDMLRRFLRRFGRPDPADMRTINADRFDERLISVEQKQRRIDARLTLLERQSNPRGIAGDLD